MFHWWKYQQILVRDLDGLTWPELRALNSFRLLSQEILIEKCVVKGDGLVLIRVHAVDLVLEHEPELEHLLVRPTQMRDNLAENAILLRLCHHLKQLVEPVSWEYLSVTLREQKEFSKDKQDRFLLVFKREEELLLQTDVLIASPKCHKFLNICEVLVRASLDRYILR